MFTNEDFPALGKHRAAPASSGAKDEDDHESTQHGRGWVAGSGSARSSAKADFPFPSQAAFRKSTTQRGVYETHPRNKRERPMFETSEHARESAKPWTGRPRGLRSTNGGNLPRSGDKYSRAPANLQRESAVPSCQISNRRMKSGVERPRKEDASRVKPRFDSGQRVAANKNKAKAARESQERFLRDGSVTKKDKTGRPVKKEPSAEVTIFDFISATRNPKKGPTPGGGEAGVYVSQPRAARGLSDGASRTKSAPSGKVNQTQVHRGFQRLGEKKKKRPSTLKKIILINRENRWQEHWQQEGCLQEGSSRALTPPDADHVWARMAPHGELASDESLEVRVDRCSSQPHCQPGNAPVAIQHKNHSAVARPLDGQTSQPPTAIVIRNIVSEKDIVDSDTFSASMKHVRDLCEKFGQIVDMLVVRDKDVVHSGTTLAIGARDAYAEFASSFDAARAAEGLKDEVHVGQASGVELLHALFRNVGGGLSTCFVVVRGLVMQEELEEEDEFEDTLQEAKEFCESMGGTGPLKVVQATDSSSFEVGLILLFFASTEAAALFAAKVDQKRYAGRVLEASVHVGGSKVYEGHGADMSVVSISDPGDCAPVAAAGMGEASLPPPPDLEATRLLRNNVGSVNGAEGIESLVEREVTQVRAPETVAILVRNLVSEDDVDGYECYLKASEDIRSLCSEFANPIFLVIVRSKDNIVTRSNSRLPSNGVYIQFEDSVNAACTAQGLAERNALDVVLLDTMSMPSTNGSCLVVIEGLVTEEDLEEDDELDDVKEDAKEFCVSCGGSQDIEVVLPEAGSLPTFGTASILVPFDNIADAALFAVKVDQRQYAGRTLNASVQVQPILGVLNAGDDRLDGSLSAPVRHRESRSTQSEASVSVEGRANGKQSAAEVSARLKISGATQSMSMVDRKGDHPAPNPKTLTKYPAFPAGADRRNYVDHMPDATLSALAATVLSKLAAFQKAYKQKNPNNARLRRRLVMGLKEVLVGVERRKLLCVMLATNLEECQGERGLDERVGQIISRATEHEIPLLFPMSRRKMGKALGKSIKVSAAGIYDASGADAELKTLLATLQDVRRRTLQ